MAIFTKASGVEVPARVSGDRRALTRDYLYDLALKGRIYIAGVGLEGSSLEGMNTLTANTPSIALYSTPDTIVVPLHFEALMSVQGSAAPDWYITYLNADSPPTTNGTTVPALSFFGPNGRASSAILQTDPTITSFANADNTLLRTAQNLLTAYLLTEAVTKAAGTKQDNVNNDGSRLVWSPGIPIPMKDGASFLVHFEAPNATGAEYEWSLIWAEIDSGDV